MIESFDALLLMEEERCLLNALTLAMVKHKHFTNGYCVQLEFFDNVSTNRLCTPTGKRKPDTET